MGITNIVAEILCQMKKDDMMIYRAELEGKQIMAAATKTQFRIQVTENGWCEKAHIMTMPGGINSYYVEEVVRDVLGPIFNK